MMNVLLILLVIRLGEGTTTVSQIEFKSMEACQVAARAMTDEGMQKYPVRTRARCVVR